MSVAATQWAWELDLREPSASQKSTVHHARKLVLLCLADHADDNGACFPGQRLIAGRTGLSVRSVVDHTGWLEKQGYLARAHRHRPNGSRTSDEYHLHLHAAHAPSDLDTYVHDRASLSASHDEPTCKSLQPYVHVLHPHNRKVTTSEPSGGEGGEEPSDNHNGHHAGQGKGFGHNDTPPPPAEPETSGPQDEAENNGRSKEEVAEAQRRQTAELKARLAEAKIGEW